MKAFVNSKKRRIFAPAIEVNNLTHVAKRKQPKGPFVYRLGRQVFILERGVRLPYGLQKKIKI